MKSDGTKKRQRIATVVVVLVVIAMVITTVVPAMMMQDSKTHQTVLKKGTTYQIYKADEDGNETLVTQKYSNGNAIVVVDRFVTDDTGEIITYPVLNNCLLYTSPSPRDRG